MKKIKKPPIGGGSRIKVSDKQTDETFILDYPVFCFKHLHPSYNIDACSDDDKCALVQRLAKLSQMTWTQIQLAPRHGLGSEKISRGSIKKDVPVSITDDVKDFLALRYNGLKALVGYQNKFVFHIVFIDHDFSVYDHGN